MDKKGAFITFEGIDGCGKSTQVKKFVNYLFGLDKHNHIIFTRNPYKDTNIRATIRSNDNPLSQADELANLFIEDRKKQVEEVVLPNLKLGHFVVSDRYKLSTLSYQSAQGLDIYDLIKRHEGLPIPEITFIIDVSAEEAAKRMKKEKERNEHKFEANLDFTKKLRENYLRIKDVLKSEKIFIIDGERDPEIVFNDIKNVFEKEFYQKLTNLS